MAAFNPIPPDDPDEVGASVLAGVHRAEAAKLLGFVEPGDERDALLVARAQAHATLAIAFELSVGRLG